MMSKIKRPEKPPSGMPTVNGATPSATSSPSIPTTKPPPILPGASASNSGLGLSNGVARTANRPRRDAPPQALGRGQRTASAGLRSASMQIDTPVVQVAQPPPYIQSDNYILKKYRDCSPSLVVHLHPTHFRFDQQDGTFTYKSPMKIFIEHLRTRTVPHDLMEYFTLWGIQFYEGCLIVEVHDHKSIATAKESSQTPANAEKAEPFSIHNYNAYLTPSPWAPYPKENLTAMGKAGSLPDKTSDGEKTKTAAEKDKENMPAPGQPGDASRSKSASKKARVSTVVLHPTAITQYIDLAIKASTPAATPSSARRESYVDGIGATPISATGPRPQTPLIAIPSTPHLGMDPPPAKRARREKMELDGKNIYTAESQIKLATTAPLYLEPVESASQAGKLLEVLSHPEHSSSVPQPKTRKKTVAEMAAEESAAADEEQYMLILDERYNTGAPGGANPVDGDGQVAGASFEPRFERFKAIDSIKLQVEENKKREKIRQAEAVKKQHQEQEAREKANAEAKKRQQEEDARRQAHIQLQQQQMRQQAQQQATETIRRQQAVMGQSQNAQNQQAMKGAQAQNPHGHPPQNMGMQNAANGMNATQQRMMQQQQQFSQAQASSPIVRNATPHNVSSPMVASNLGTAMQQSTSSMGGSPPRSASVVQQTHQMTPAIAHAMRAQGSQQSHGGTPRMPNTTPQMPHGQMNQTPRMSQASPIPGHMIQTPQMGAANMMPNGQIVSAQMQQAQIIAQQQQQHQQRLRQQQAAQMGSSPIAQQQMTSQQFMQAQQMAAQQHMAQQQQPGMMAANPITAQYAAQMRAMVAAQAQNSMQQSGQNFMPGKPQVTPQMIQQAQQQAQHQAALQQAQQPMPGQQQQAMIQNQIQQLARQIYQQQLPAFMNQWNGNPPPEAQAQYRQNCTQQAQMKMRARMQVMHQNNQSVRMQQQMMAAQQQGMAGMGGPMNGMNGGMNGMGMQRPPGM